MKVYVITKGEYSDYHICAVVENKAKAELLKEALTDKWEEPYIEEYDTEDVNIDGYLKYDEYLVEQDITTGEMDVCKLEKSTDFICASQVIDDESRGYQCPEKANKLTTVVYADDAKGAIKIASDIFAKYRAEKCGL